MSRIWLGALVTIGMVALAPVCEAQTIPGFREAGESTRVRLFTRSEAKPGRRERTDLQRTDAYLARLEVQLGQPLPERIDYYRYERPEDIAAQTGVYATGLTHVGDAVVYSTLDYHPHELVHAVAGRMGDPGRFFHEGLAVALGDEGRWGARDVHDLARPRARAFDWPTLRDGFDRLEADVAYPLAGSFVKHLIEREGLGRLAAFFRACSGPRNAASAFRATYGRSLDDAVADWQQRLGSGRKDFPSTGNASRIAAAAAPQADSGNTLADLRLAPEAALGTSAAIRR